ncbi:MAG: glycosyltransferase [Acaryochloridaceae cyanobacterium RL_2_7]|nr:glycosyltransferase [Acaryochloridaceae cyanobacterium RL_2_7]
MVSSIHTDSALYAQIYLEGKLEKMFGDSAFTRFLTQTLALPTRYKQSLDRKQVDYWNFCDHVWYSQPREKEALAKENPGVSISRLRRGLNLEMFSPEAANRVDLCQRYSIPEEAFLLLFVGRLDACKNVMTYAQTVKMMVERGIPVHGVAAGHGSQAEAIQSELGEHVSLLGNQPQEHLALVYASCDAFVFPSETETVGNVVLEAKASGLVPFVSDQGGVTQLIRNPGEDGFIISGQDPKDWANAVQSFLELGDRRSEMSHAANRHVRENWPTWDTVFKEDLLPYWQKFE